MRFRKISRRKFILAALLATPCAVLGDACPVEPAWVMIRRLVPAWLGSLLSITTGHEKPSAWEAS
jgi:hypothetical protein